MDWAMLCLLGSLIILLVITLVALVADKGRDIALWALLIVFAFSIVVVVLTILGPVPEPFHTINHSLTGV